MKTKKKKKGKSLRVVFQNLVDFRAQSALEMDKAIKSKKRVSDRELGIVRFENESAYRKFMSTGKLEILVAILNKKPQSIYELAKMTGRSFSNVLKDCQDLTQVGFINLTEVGDLRESKRPELTFEYERIVIEMPQLGSYEINFKAA